MALSEIDFSDLEFEEIGIWPIEVRIIAFAAIFIASIILGYFVILKGSIDELKQTYATKEKLKEDFKTKYGQSVNLDVYKEQLKELNLAFMTFKKQLPLESNITSLLDDISLQAGAYGIDFKLIKPGKPTVEQYYTFMPIQLEMIGRYHDFGKFVSGLSKLPRIVTLHDFSIERSLTSEFGEQEAAAQGKLEMSVEAKTYWYTGK